MSMNWGDIVGEPERSESAVSNLGGTTFIAGNALRLSSDIDRYRVPSQDWGYPAFNMSRTLSRAKVGQTSRISRFGLVSSPDL